MGDDTTDEDAILAVQALGGSGVRVGGGASAALFRLADLRPCIAGWLRPCAG